MSKMGHISFKPLLTVSINTIPDMSQLFFLSFKESILTTHLLLNLLMMMPMEQE